MENIWLEDGNPFNGFEINELQNEIRRRQKLVSVEYPRWTFTSARTGNSYTLCNSDRHDRRIGDLWVSNGNYALYRKSPDKNIFVIRETGSEIILDDLVGHYVLDDR